MRSFVLSLAAAAALFTGCNHQPGVPVTASAETDPVMHEGDVADDPAIWTDGKETLIIGTHKKGGGLEVYDLSGKRLQSLPEGKFNNVDLRYGMEVGGKKLDIVAASNRTDDTLALYAVDPDTRKLVPIADGKIPTVAKSYGFCMYHDLGKNAYYAIVNNKEGRVVQMELFDAGNGKVGAKTVRTFDVGSQTEGCVADDETGYLYVGEEEKGVWKYAAGADQDDRRKLIDHTGKGGHLTADVEGISLYLLENGEGYLVVSSQGSHSYNLYDRKSGKFLGDFHIADGEIDGTCETDGLDVTSANLGADYPKGILVVQDGEDLPGGTQNFKIVDFRKILSALGLEK